MVYRRRSRRSYGSRRVGRRKYKRSTTATYRRRKVYKAKRKSRKPASGLPRPVRLGLLQPYRALVKHKLCIQDAFQFDAAAYVATLTSGIAPFPEATPWAIAELHDINPLPRFDNYPTNFNRMANMYQNYLVRGVKITAMITGGGGQSELDSFWSCFYDVPGTTEDTQPSDPYLITDEKNVEGLMQLKGVNKKWFIGSGQNHSRSRKHSVYFDVSKTQGQSVDTCRMDSSGTVSSLGALVKPPVWRPMVYHKLVCSETGGYRGGASSLYFVRYFVTFYVEWWNFRRDFLPHIAENEEETPSS